MAKLQIKGKSLNPNDLKILIDGVQISMLKSLRLKLDPECVNTCSITFYVDDVDIDAEVLAELEARVKNKQQG